MEWSDFLKLYGPLSLGWIGFAWLGKWVLDRFDKQTETMVKLAVSLEALTNAIKEDRHA